MAFCLLVSIQLSAYAFGFLPLAFGLKPLLKQESIKRELATQFIEWTWSEPGFIPAIVFYQGSRSVLANISKYSERLNPDSFAIFLSLLQPS
ncbi:hypothetical protein [Moorena sp. SIO1G6]|uniref:hypothetical protein n=1 Tax=Moorena sp. SIO1G6 TaxID=2607840 RepID=UPI00257FFEDD|nr:hypothetical protein [Moorena sp. SIO1G6]